MTLSKNLSAHALIAEIHSNAASVRSKTLDAKDNNSMNGSYRNIFAVIRLQQADKKIRMAERQQVANFKLLGNTKKKVRK